MKMDDSDFDEYVEFYNENILWQNKRYFRDVENPLVMYNDQQFKRRYRFKKNTVVDVRLPLIGNFNKTMRSLYISPLLKILVALRFYATDSSQINNNNNRLFGPVILFKKTLGLIFTLLHLHIIYIAITINYCYL